MLVHVTSDNELIWNALCRALWPQLGKDEMLFARRAGKLPYEFLYMETEEAWGFLSLSLRHDYVEHGCQELASDCDVHDKDSEGFHKSAGFVEASRNIHFVMKL